MAYPCITAEEIKELEVLILSLDKEWREPMLASHLMKKGITSLLKAYDGKVDYPGTRLVSVDYHHQVDMKNLKVFGSSMETIAKWRPVLIDLLRNPDTFPSCSCLTPFGGLGVFKEVRWFPTGRTKERLEMLVPSVAESLTRADNTMFEEEVLFPPPLKLTRKYEMQSYQNTGHGRELVVKDWVHEWLGRYEEGSPAYPEYFDGFLLAWNRPRGIIYLISV